MSAAAAAAAEGASDYQIREKGKRFAFIMEDFNRVNERKIIYLKNYLWHEILVQRSFFSPPSSYSKMKFFIVSSLIHIPSQTNSCVFYLTLVFLFFDHHHHHQQQQRKKKKTRWEICSHSFENGRNSSSTTIYIFQLMCLREFLLSSMLHPVNPKKKEKKKHSCPCAMIMNMISLLISWAMCTSILENMSFYLMLFIIYLYVHIQLYYEESVYSKQNKKS